MKNGTGRPVLLAASLILAIAVTVTAGGCISDQGSFNNVEVSGYVMSESDSTPVQGALVIVDVDVLTDLTEELYTDSEGYYKYNSTFPTRDWNPLEILVTVADVDGEANGIFISEDTLLYEDNTEHLLDITFRLDFYVEFIEDTTSLGYGPSL